MENVGINISSSATSDQTSEKKKKKPDLPIVPIKNTADYQRMKLERLMANPEKPVVIPVRPNAKNMAPPPEFVRNVMGSSAGAGSGEFHVYRHLRRKEYARQRTITEKARLEALDEEFLRKIDENKKIAEEKTAKKRAKRLKRKEKLKNKKSRMDTKINKKEDNESDSSDDDSNNSDPGDDKTSNNDKGEKKSNNNNNSNNRGSVEQKNGSNKKTQPLSNNKSVLLYSSASFAQPLQDSDSTTDSD